MRRLCLLILFCCLAPALAQQENEEPTTTVELEAPEAPVRPRRPQLELWPADEAYRRLQLERRLKGEETPEPEPTSLELSHSRPGGWQTRVLASTTPDLSELGLEQQLSLPDDSQLELRWGGKWGEEQLQQLALGWEGGGESVRLDSSLEGRWLGDALETQLKLGAGANLGLGFEAFTSAERHAQTSNEAQYQADVGLRFSPWNGYQLSLSSQLTTQPEGLPLQSYKGNYSGWFVGATRLTLETEQKLGDAGRASRYSAKILYQLDQWLSISSEAERRFEVDGSTTDSAGGNLRLHW